MLRDTEFFKSRISKIDGAGDIGDFLVNIVTAKAVAEQPKPSTDPPTIPKEPALKLEDAGADEKK